MYDGVDVLSRLVRPKCIVLSGGGLKGLYILGALHTMEAAGLMSRVDTFYGTSIGVLIAAAISLGYTVQECIDMMSSFDAYSLILPDIDNLFDNGYICNPAKYHAFLKALVTLRGCDDALTLSQFHNSTGKTIHAVVFNLTRMKGEVISHHNAPNLPLWKLLYMTSAIPFVFPPMDHEGSLYVDGAMHNNFPMDLVPPDQHADCLGISTHCSPELCTPHTELLRYTLLMFDLYGQHTHTGNVISVPLLPDTRMQGLSSNASKTLKRRMVQHGAEHAAQALPQALKYLIKLHTDKHYDGSGPREV